MLEKIKKIVRIVRWPYSVYQDSREYRRLLEEHGDIDGKLSEHSGLVERYGDLEGKLGLLEEFPKMRERLLSLTSELESLKITRKEMIETAKINRPYTQALEKWKSVEIDPLKKELGNYERELDMLRGSVFSIAVNTVIGANPKIQKIPFIYYDIKNRCAICTDATYDFLGIESTPKELSIEEMFDYIRSEDKVGIMSSLKNKKRVRHYEALTLDNKELKLSITFYDYDRKTVGAGISLYDPKFSKDFRLRISFARQLKRATRAVSDQLKLVGENIRTANRPYLGNFDSSNF